MKYPKISESLTQSQITYIREKIQEITVDYAQESTRQKQCLWEVASTLDLIEDLDPDGELTPTQSAEVFDFSIRFLSWYYLQKFLELHPWLKLLSPKAT